MAPEERVKTDKELLEDRLIELFIKNDESIVVSLTGGWGIGKTFFWQAFAETHFANSLLSTVFKPMISLIKEKLYIFIKLKDILKIGIPKNKSAIMLLFNKVISKKSKSQNLASNISKKKYAYVSLFGKESLKDINKAIVLQVSLLNGYINAAQRIIKGFKIYGFDISSSLSVLEIKNFKDVVICFDDLERMSQRIDIKDVMGLISELKEQKKCKILIIENIGQLSEIDKLYDFHVLEHKQEAEPKRSNSPQIDHIKKYTAQPLRNHEIFKLFSDKIIDFKLKYNPTIKENFDLVKDQLKYFEADVIVELLETDVFDGKEKNIRLMKQFINNLNIFAFLEKSSFNKLIINSIVNEVYLKTYDRTNHSSKFSLINLINVRSLVPYIHDSIDQNICVKQKNIITKINEIAEEHSLWEIKKNIDDIYYKKSYHINYSNIEFNNDLFSIFLKNKNNLIKILGFVSFKNYIDILKKDEVLKEDLYSFFIEATKTGIDQVFKNSTKHSTLLDERFFSDIEQTGEESLKQYIYEKKNEYKSNFTKDPENIIELANKITNDKGWNPSDEELLSSISVEEHKAFILNTEHYLEAVYIFVLRRGNSDSFSIVFNNFFDALQHLANEEEYYRSKVNWMIERLQDRKDNKR